jgi:hypothetical protein
MAKPKYSYNYDHDANTTTITTVEELNGQIITTTKTVEGNQIPQKSFMPTTIGGKVVLGLVALSGLQIFLTIAPQLIITPAAIFGAVKFTKNKTNLEKTIAVTVAVVGSFIACSLFFETSVPSTSSSISYESDESDESDDECLSKLETNKNIVDLAINNSGKTMSEKNDWLRISEQEYQSVKADYSKTGVCNVKSLVP